MLDEIRALGFANVELSHGIRISLVEGIERALKKNPELRISSLHNFCPLPVGFMHAAPNIYLLSSTSERERQKAGKQANPNTMCGQPLHQEISVPVASAH